MKKVFPKENLRAKKGNYADFFACSKKDGDFTDHGELIDERIRGQAHPSVPLPVVMIGFP